MNMKGNLYKRKRTEVPANKRRISGERTRIWDRGPSMRRDGLLAQFMHRNKTSVVVDSRIGESSAIEEEHKYAKRMAVEKHKQYSKKGVFNLNDDDDETLTHKGQSITNIERYDDPRDNSSSEDELLDKDFVEEAHFGGFLRKKTSDPHASDLDGREKTKKEIIEELILNTKAKKLEKSKQGDEYLSKVSNLNTLFKDEGIMSLVQSVSTKKEAFQAIVTGKSSDSVQRRAADETLMSSEDLNFSRIVRELRFEAKPARVEPTHHLQTSEDLGAEFYIDESGTIPLPLAVPDSYDDYVKLLKVYAEDLTSPVQYDLGKFSYIHDKMIDNHLASHRGKLTDLCKYLIKFIMKLANQIDIYDSSAPFTYSPYIFHRIAEVNPVACADVFSEVIKVQHQQFTESSPRKLRSGTIVLFAICSHIFENLEVRHRVLTPILLFIFQILSEFKVTNSKTARKVTQLCYDGYTLVQESQRYAPEILMCLCSLLKCFDNQPALDTAISGFHFYLKRNDALYEILVPVLTLIKKFIKLYSSYTTATDMFRPISDALNVLKNRAWIECEWPVEYSPEVFKKSINEVILSLEHLSKTREPPRTATALPKPLRLYEPEFQEVFTGRKQRHTTRDQQDHTRLLHKIKQEQKGAIRELKKDSAFLARAQQLQQAQMDMTRKRKVNMIMGSLSNQEGDFKKIRRGK